MALWLPGCKVCSLQETDSALADSQPFATTANLSDMEKVGVRKQLAFDEVLAPVLRQWLSSAIINGGAGVMLGPVC